MLWADVLIVEDHPLVRLGLSHCLKAHPRLNKCGEAETETDACREVESKQPDVAIIDLTLKSGSGLDLIRKLSRRHPNVRIVVSSMYERVVYEQRALAAGADAYVCKQEGIDSLMRAVEAAAFERPERQRPSAKIAEDPVTHRLTDRELQVFRLIGEGRSTREIGSELKRSVKTIEAHKAKLKRKLSLTNATELARDATRWVVASEAA